MKTIKQHVLILIILVFSLTACSQWEKPTLVSCSSTMTEIIYEIGAGNQVLGATSFCFSRSRS